MSQFATRLAVYQERVNAALLIHLPADDASRTHLQAAMRYSVTNGGKRIRPFLTYATGRSLGVSLERLDIPSCAVEMMHAYFDEATAILAGDALQALAFSLLAINPDPELPESRKLKMIAVLGDASGASGMAAGQAIDLESVGQRLALGELEDMHRLKTGALIRASVLLAGLTAENANQELLTRLDQFAAAVGLCFQIVDDILDVVADTETLGKTQGADIALDKPTYPALLGLDGARKHAVDMHEAALGYLDGLDSGFDELRDLSAYVVERSY